MSSTLTNLTAATTWSGTDLFYMLVGGNSRKIAASSLLVTDAANVLSDVNGTNAQTFRIYRTFTDSSNYERLALTSASGTFQITAETAGTGTDNFDISLTTAGTGRVYCYGGFRVASGTGGLGYHNGVGIGAEVTQLTSKSTTVTSNTVCGRVIMHNASLAADASVSFTVSNTLMTDTDVVIANFAGAGTAGAYRIEPSLMQTNQFAIIVTNITAGALGEAIWINWAIMKSSAN